MDTRRLDEDNYRKDHKDFGEVYNTTYEEGEITSFYTKTDDPIELDDTCRVKLGSGEFEKVPIFYHCKKHYYSDDSGTERENGALKHAALSFQLESKVKVMVRENSPVFVVAHSDGLPRRCFSIFRHHFHTYATGITANPDPTPFYRWFNPIKQLEKCALSTDPEGCTGPDGKSLDITRKGTLICGKREIQFGTVTYYMGDWLIELGPLMYLWQVYAIGLPLPFTGTCKLSAAAANKELREYLIDWGIRKESILPTHIFTPLPEFVTPEGFVEQTQMTSILMNMYQGWRPPQPRWVYSEFHSQESQY